jgi:hypothetical protein
MTPLVRLENLREPGPTIGRRPDSRVGNISAASGDTERHPTFPQAPAASGALASWAWFAVREILRMQGSRARPNGYR